MRKHTFVRFFVVLGLSVFLAACGNSHDDGNNDVKPPVVDTNVTTTGLQVFTSICSTSSSCSVDAVPYQVVLTIEWQRPGDFAWIKIGEVDSGALGQFTVGIAPGTYRVKAKTAPATANDPSAVEVVVQDIVKDVVLVYHQN